MVPAVPVVIIPAAAAVIAATAAAERPTYPQKGEAPRERCLFRFRGIGGSGGTRTAQAVFSAPADRGTRTAAGVFVPDGRLFFQHRLRGVRELPQACSPLTGGEFFAEPQRGVAPPLRRERAAPRGWARG